MLGFTNLNISEENGYANINDTFEIFKLNPEDFLPYLDFTLSDTLEIPSLIYGFPFPPGLEIPYNFENNENFIFDDLQLNEINFNNLKVRYTVESNINGGIYFNLTIPTATNENGQIFNEIISIPNSNGQINTYSGDIFLEDYKFDLSNNQSTFNNIRTSLRIGCADDNIDNISLNSNSFLSLKLSLKELNINNIKGYLGNLKFNDSSIFNLPMMEKFSSSNLQIENPQVELLVKNGLGIDAQISTNELSFEKNESIHYLEHSLINSPININRALDLGWDFQYSNQSIKINNQNSNLDELTPLFPEKINLKYQLETNPLGNHSGYNDFYNSEHTLEAKLAMNIPFKFNINNFIFRDTINISIPPQIDAKNGQIFLKVKNEFPLRCCITLALTNGDTLATNQNCISPANFDSFGNISSAQTSELIIEISNQNLNQIIDTKKLLFIAKLNSPDPIINFPISSFQKITYNMGLELNSTINIQ